MKQVLRRVLDAAGKVRVEEVPAPRCSRNGVLIDVRRSLISSGTERGTLAKTPLELTRLVMTDPWMRKAVLQMLSGGLAQTANKVVDELKLPREIGYSGAGVIREIGANVSGHQVGQRVAYAAAGHASVVNVSRTLSVAMPDNVSFEEACFSTVGAIALNGVRKSGAVLGEKIAVIGLGLVGQLTCQLLLAAGCEVLGVDISEGKIASAKAAGIHFAVNSAEADAVALVREYCGGAGADRVIMCAQTTDEKPANDAMKMCRAQGQVTFVGIVAMNLERMPFFKGELNLNFARAYGPGIMDAAFERGERDYPKEYVPFTAQDNMATFLRLIGEGKVNVKRFISASYPIEDAQSAYDSIFAKSSANIAVVLEYPETSLLAAKADKMLVAKRPHKSGKIGIGLIGAGNFTRGFHLPNMKSHKLARLEIVATASGATGKHVLERFDVSKATTDSEEVFLNEGVDLVYIGTRHDSHASLAEKALNAGKAVLCEKPISLTLAGLWQVLAAQRASGSFLSVGYNRRYAPTSRKLKSLLPAGVARVINYTVSSGRVPADHWTLDERSGGGRLLGECDHFFDLMVYFSGATPIEVFAHSHQSGDTPLWKSLNFSVQVRFSDGSLGHLTYTDQAGAGQPRERVEIHSGGQSWQLEDFNKVFSLAKGRKSVGAAKGLGHAEELDFLLRHLAGEQVADLVGPREVELATLCTQAALRSLETGAPVTLDQLRAENHNSA